MSVVSEQISSAVGCMCCRNDQTGIPIDILHFRGLDSPIGVIILNNAQRINPKIGNS